MRLVFFILAIANAFLVWRHFDELMLIAVPAEAQSSDEAGMLAASAHSQMVSAGLASDDKSIRADLQLKDQGGLLVIPEDGLSSRSQSSGVPSEAESVSYKSLDSADFDASNEVPRQCYWAGPLDANEPAGNALMKRLQALRISVSDHRVRSAGPERFWVIIPKAKLSGSPASVIAALKKAKIDSYEIGRGDHAGAISLGFYSREALAHARTEKAARSGWSSEIVRVATSRHYQWLQVDKQQADAVGEGILVRMVKNNSGVEIIEKKCELPVASHNNIH